MCRDLRSPLSQRDEELVVPQETAKLHSVRGLSFAKIAKQCSGHLGLTHRDVCRESLAVLLTGHD